MNLQENVRLAIAGLLANKMRALLTMLGIIIGIGSVIAITSIGGSMTQSISSSMESMGVNNIALQIMPRDLSGGYYYYTEDDFFTDEMIEVYQKRFSDKIQGIALTEPVGTGEISQRRETYKVDINGVNSGFATGATGMQINLKQGRFINDADGKRSKHVAVISERLAEDLFPNGQNAIGQEIKVELDVSGREIFTVVGIYKEEVSNFLMGTASTTTTLYIPLETAYEIENVSSLGYSYFYVAATPGIDYQSFAQESADFFNDRYYAKNKNMMCDAQSLDSMVGQVRDVMGTISTAIAVIAAISLLVGGIGVMNIMLVSVTERTREIGIRKALGAPDSAIRIQFIVESIIICSIGGAIGILLGSGLGYLGGIFLQSPTTPSLSSIVIAVGFSMLIGIFFGYYPANKAAQLDPIESLRYE